MQLASKFPPVCMGCTQRKVGCHQTCKTYLNAKCDYGKKTTEAWQRKRRECEINSVDILNRIRIIEKTRRY